MNVKDKELVSLVQSMLKDASQSCPLAGSSIIRQGQPVSNYVGRLRTATPGAFPENAS